MCPTCKRDVAFNLSASRSLVFSASISVFISSLSALLFLVDDPRLESRRLFDDLGIVFLPADPWLPWLGARSDPQLLGGHAAVRKMIVPPASESVSSIIAHAGGGCVGVIIASSIPEDNPFATAAFSFDE